MDQNTVGTLYWGQTEFKGILMMLGRSRCACFSQAKCPLKGQALQKILWNESGPISSQLPLMGPYLIQRILRPFFNICGHISLGFTLQRVELHTLVQVHRYRDLSIVLTSAAPPIFFLITVLFWLFLCSGSW